MEGGRGDKNASQHSTSLVCQISENISRGDESGSQEMHPRLGENLLFALVTGIQKKKMPKNTKILFALITHPEETKICEERFW